MKVLLTALGGAMIISASSAGAQQTPQVEPTTYVGIMALPVPVTAADVIDRPYCEIGPVKKEVRKATVFSKASSPQKVRRELWESAKKKGADAVLKFESGNSRITGISWGATPVKGVMVKFTTAGQVCPTPLPVK